MMSGQSINFCQSVHRCACVHVCLPCRVCRNRPVSVLWHYLPYPTGGAQDDTKGKDGKPHNVKFEFDNVFDMQVGTKY